MQGLSESMAAGAIVGYSAWAALVVGGVWWRARALDDSAGAAEVALPADPDARRVAYLEGGESGLIRVMTLELCARGFLRLGAQEAAFTETLYVVRDPDGPHPNLLSAPERMIYDAVSESALLERLEEDGPLRVALASYARALHTSLASERLAWRAEQLAARRLAGGVGIALLVAGWLGVFLMMGAAPERWSLVVALCVGLLAGGWLFGNTVWSHAPHITRQGQRWVGALRQAYRPMLDRVGRAARSGQALALADEGSLLIALFGPRRFREQLMAPAAEQAPLR